MSRQNVEDLHPLSPLQQGMLFHSIASEGLDPYVQYFALHLHGALRVEEFGRAWQTVADRHPALRSGFVWEKVPQPVQVVFRRLEIPFRVLDWRSVPAAEQIPRLMEWMEDDVQAGFEHLGRPPLIRLTLVRLAEREHVLVVTSHHLLVDGWSLPVVVGEVIALYDGALAGTEVRLPPARPFRDYVAWLNRQDLSRAEGFWRRALAGIEAPTPLWGDRAPERAREAIEETGDLKVVLAGDLKEAMVAMARQHRVTANTLLQAAWGLVLARAAGLPHALFGATVSGRPPELEGVERMVGMFINTVPVRVDVPEDATVLEWLRVVQALQAEAREFEYAPLVSVHGWSEVHRDVPFFESLLVFENFPQDAASNVVEGVQEEGSDRLGVDTLNARERTSFPLTLLASLHDVMRLTLVYDAGRFGEEDAWRLLGAFSGVLQQIVVDPHAPLRAISLLSPEERRSALAGARGAETRLPAEERIHDLFQAQAARNPGALALVFGTERVGYGELNARANRLARHLRALGVGPEARVGVCMERAPEMVVALLAVLKAGGSYVPMDPAYPAERIGFMLEDSGARVLLTQARLDDRIPATRARVVRVDADHAEFAGLDAADLADVPVRAENAAYCIYTSGSTGKPKGVVIEHRATVAFVHWMRGRYTDEERGAILGSTSISFDVSVAELYGSLCLGGTLVLVENALSPLPLGVEVTMACMVPSAAAELLRADTLPAGLRVLNLAGEALPPVLARGLYERGTLEKVVNVYGPTEDTTYSTYSLVEAGGGRVLIGRPIDNSRAYVLDAALEPVPAAVPGELYLAGAGVARGYLGRPALTAERFLPDPYGPAGSRMYRVGDLARHDAQGELEYLGRVDQQVKVRGFRIELGEIESVLSEHPGVEGAVVLAREDAPGDRRLVAYVVPREGAAMDVAELKTYLRVRLPDYMVPAIFVTLDALPLTPNGKTDRRALPAPSAELMGLEATYVAADGATEQTLATIWAEVLGLEKVGVNDSFFDLGGHSLLLARLQGRIRDALEKQVSMLDLFRFPTVRALAAHLQDEGAGDGRAGRGREKGELRRAARDRRERRGVGA